jgi:carbon storage regulator
MLVLTRKEGETIAIGEEIEIRVLRIDGDQIRLGIVAPRQMTVLRGELLLEINQETAEAGASKSVTAKALQSLAKAARVTVPVPAKK